MAIEFGCPVCGGTLRVADDAVGQVVRCGGCLAMLRVPETAAPPHSSASASPFPGSPDIPAHDVPLPARPPLIKSPRPDESVREYDHVSEQPRRRVRREPPAPTGRSPFFWATIVVGVLGFGACIICCGILSFMSKERWRTYNSSKGGFKVDLPSIPRENMTIRDLKQDKSYKVEGAHLFILEGQDYAILYKDIDSTVRRNDINKGVFDAAKNDLTKTGLQEDGAGKPRVMSGFPASEFRFHGSLGGTYAVCVVVADTRMYILIAGGRTSQPEEENVQRFFDSFTVTDEKLIQGYERGRVHLLGKVLTENLLELGEAERKLAEKPAPGGKVRD